MDIEAVLLYTELEESTLNYLMAINQFPLPLHLSNDAHLRGSETKLMIGSKIHSAAICESIR